MMENNIVTNIMIDEKHRFLKERLSKYNFIYEPLADNLTLDIVYDLFHKNKYIINSDNIDVILFLGVHAQFILLDYALAEKYYNNLVGMGAKSVGYHHLGCLHVNLKNYQLAEKYSHLALDIVPLITIQYMLLEV